MRKKLSDQEPSIHRAYSFLKTVTLVLTRPRAFFAAYFHQPEQLEAMQVPLPGALGRIVSTTLTIMPPLRCLGTALGVLGFVRKGAFET